MNSTLRRVFMLTMSLAILAGLVLFFSGRAAAQAPFGDQQFVNTPDPDSDPTNGTNGNADGAQLVYAADVDGDGDLDVLSASQNDDKIAWYENTDGTARFDKGTHLWHDHI